MKSQRKGLSEKEAGRLGYLASKEANIKKYLDRIREYEEHPNMCLCCGKVIEYESRSNKFCSRSCSARYNNLIRSEEIKNKQKESLRKTLKSKLKKSKEKHCSVCGSVIGCCPRPDVCCKHQLFKTMSLFGLDISKKGTLDIICEYDNARQTIENIYKNHVDDETLKKFGYFSGLSNFHKVLKSLGIPIRSCREAVLDSYLLGYRKIDTPKTKYICGYHETWYGEKVYLRSSYEFEYALILDAEKTMYYVEYLRIKYYDTVRQQYRCAVPDFYLPETNEIVEIKSIYTLNIQNMKDRAVSYKKLGYGFRLLLDHKFVDLNLL